MKSRVFSTKLFKNNISGSTWILVLLSIGFFFAFPVASLLQISSMTTYRYPLAQDQFPSLCLKLILGHLLPGTGLVIILAAAFLNAVVGYFYLYSREKVDFYHSLPLKRRHMFLQKLGMGLVYTVIPYAVMLLLTSLVLAVRGCFRFEMIGLAFQMLAAHLIAYLFLYFCFVLIFCMTGNVLMGILSIFGFALYGPILYLVLRGYHAEFFRNFSGDDSEWMLILQKFTPFTVIKDLCLDTPFTFGSMLTAIFWTILLGILSYFAYTMRTSESTGKSMVYEWFGILLKYAVVIPCGLGAGLIMYSLQPSAREVWGIFGILAGVLLSKGMMEVLYTFDFRSFLKHKLQTIFSLAAVLFITGIFVFDFFGYASYLPSYDKLAGINLSTNDLFSNSYLDILDDGYSTNTFQFGRDAMYYQNEQEIGPELYQALESIVAENAASENIYGRRTTIKYQLKSGGYVYRSYVPSTENLKKLYHALYAETNFKEKQLTISKLDASKYLADVTALLVDQKDYTLFANNQEKKQALVDALVADYMDASPEELTSENAVTRLVFDYQGIPVKPDSSDWYSYLNERTTWVRREYYVYPSFKRTLALLKDSDTDIPGLSLSDFDIGKAGLFLYLRTPYSDSAWEEQNFGPFEITDPKELEELIASTVAFPTPLTPILEGACVTFQPADDSENDAYLFSFTCSISSEQVPEFVQELLDQAKAGELEETIFEDSDEKLLYQQFIF